MKHFLKFILCIIFGLNIISCSLNEPESDSNILCKTPKLIISINQTRSNVGNGDFGNSTWISKGANDLSNITDEERDKVLKAIEEKVTGERISEDVVFPWTDYFLQDVISAQSNYGGAGVSGNPSASYTFEAWNTGADCSPWYHHGSDYENYDEVSNSAHLNNFFQKQNPDGSQEQIKETTLMTNMQYSTYEEIKGKQFRWYINCHENLHWYEYIVVEVDGSYYICFDFACGHKENDVDGNPGRGNTQNDWDYNDWILKITPAGNQPDVWTGDEPEEKINNNHRNEVEVNLRADEKKDNLLESHLSIHVRHSTNIEIFIPIPAKYYCEVDDMAIVEKHVKELMIHGGPYSTSYDINGNTITLNVEYSNNGIRIWTEGITEGVINYCFETYRDGITFEVWNYFNDPETGNPLLSLEELNHYLNQSTVRFINSNPEKYINGKMDDIDNTVSPDKNYYNNYKVGEHLNGSSLNEIYTLKNVN